MVWMRLTMISLHRMNPYHPPYAVLFMAALEEKILSKVKKKPSVWWRYIDDIFFIWEHGEESLQEFINEINSFHPTIKFTADWSKEKVNFLDVEVTLKNSVLSTDLFVKPTDTHQFLDPTSCHPYHCKKGIPYSQTLRLNRIYSDKTLTTHKTIQSRMFMECRRIIFNNMDLCGCLTKMSDFNFYMNYGKELKENHDQAELLLDAWMAISGKQDPEFDLQIFTQNNPYASEKVEESEQNLDCVFAGLIEKRKQGIYLIKSVAIRIDMP